ncbi:MAG: amidohydrolase family protein [Burkholderiaceae bacterium]
MIDAHFHIWQLARGDYGWLTPAMGRIHRDVSLDDWRRESRPLGVTGGVVVQAAPTEAETHFLLAQAGTAPDVLGVVGWADLLAADAPHRIAALAAHPKLKALRPMLQDIADSDWILQPHLQPAFQAMLECDLAFDALIKPVHLPRILALAQRYPSLRVVVDHGAKPDIAHGQWQDWADGMARLALGPLVFCKLSGLWTEASPGAPLDTLTRYIHHILDCFGADRVMWGSDWPVLERAGQYADWHACVMAHLTPDQYADVTDTTARRVYRL